ncbi:MAG: hypothetical protein ACM3NQ_07490 [Bacteroidales bacterium]
MTGDSADGDRASKWRRRGLVALVVVLVLLVLRVGLDLWFAHELNAETARLEKLYGRLDLQSMAPPKVPPEENRARVVRAAASLTSVGGSQWQKLGAFVAAAPAQLNPALRGEMARLVEQNGLTLQVAGEICRRSKSNWDIDYPEANRIPALVDIRGLSNLLAAASRFNVEAGRADDAAHEVTSGLCAAASLAPEPIAILQLIRMAIATDHLRALRYVVADGEPSAAALANVAQVLADSRMPDPVRMPLVGEMKFANQMWGRMEGGRSVEGYLPGSPSPAWSSPLAWAFRPFVRMMRLHYLRAAGRLIELNLSPPAARGAEAALPSKTTSWWHVRARFDAAFLGGMDRIAESGYRYLSALNVAEIVVALRRFRIDHGVYPDELTQLAPRYVTRLCADPFTGLPPEYARQGSGFTLTGHGPKVMSAADHALLEWRSNR